MIIRAIQQTILNFKLILKYMLTLFSAIT